MLSKVKELKQLSDLKARDCSAESVCVAISEIFHVRETEVALLELRGSLLNFLFPSELVTAGAIPLSSSAVAARTAQTGKAELFNTFTQVTHFSVFELVKLGNQGLDAQVIQKLMSAPILSTEGKIWGVIQVSRKASNQTIAGPDFTPADLQKLELPSGIVGRLMTGVRHFSGSWLRSD